MTEDERWMEFALKEAEQAYRREEVPIGAVVVHDRRIIGRGYNQTETLQDPTAHAEMIAITAAVTSLGSRRLEDCTLYVTLEPCLMCSGAIVLARLPRLVFGADDPKAGACGNCAPSRRSTSFAAVRTTSGVGCPAFADRTRPVRTSTTR